MPAMYDTSILVLVRGLKALASLLAAGQAHVQAEGKDPRTLVEARLAPDMLSLVGQVQRASDTAKATGQRLSGVQAPAMPDTEVTIAELIGRVEATIAYLESIPRESLEGSQTREVVLTFGPHRREFTGESYLLTFALPNFFFHVAIAHGLLRQAGVKVGKLDYLGA